MATIEFFYDFASPYSYLASARVKEVATRTGADFSQKPFVLGAVFKAVGTHMPASTPVRAAYMGRDVAIWAKDYGIPYRFPDIFPINGIKAARAVLAVADPEQAWKLAQRIYLAYWAENQDIAQADVLARLIADSGMNAADLLAATERQDIKDRLRANTEEAIARGAFGAPTMFVGDQMFIGNDRLAFVERAARGEMLGG